MALLPVHPGGGIQGAFPPWRPLVVINDNNNNNNSSTAAVHPSGGIQGAFPPWRLLVVRNLDNNSKLVFYAFSAWNLQVRQGQS